jgi:hypothetical protein
MIEYGTVTSKGLNLHGKPHADAQITDKLARGDEIEIIERLPTGWMQVITKTGRTGFVDSRFVNVKAPAPPSKPLPPVRPPPTKPAPVSSPVSMLKWGLVALVAIVITLWALRRLIF